MEFFLPGGGDIPPEIKQQLEAQATFNQMATDSIRHDIKRLLDESSIDTLMAVTHMLRSISNCAPAEAPGLAMYFLGLTTGVLQAKHNLCSACGKNHDEDLMASLQNEVKSDTGSFIYPKPKSTFAERLILIRRNFDGALDRSDELLLLIASVMRSSPSQEEISYLAEMTTSITARPPSTKVETSCMEDYNLDDLWEGDGINEHSRKFIGFICKNCSMKYSTIHDRMLKPAGPEGCDGCVQKAKFG